MHFSDESSMSGAPLGDADAYAESNAPMEDVGVDFVAAIKRYIWAVLIPGVLGLFIGAGLWTQMPPVYEAKARMLMESDRPVMLDTVTGEVVNAVPPADVIKAQLYSDEVIAKASQSDALLDDVIQETLDREFMGSFPRFIGERMEFETSSEGGSKTNSMVFDITANHTSPELTRAAVVALTEAFQGYYEGQRDDQFATLGKTLKEAETALIQNLQRLNQRKRQILASNDLQFDREGNLVNPYREQMQLLTEQKELLIRQLRMAQTEFEAIKSTLDGSNDPRTAIDIVGQLQTTQLVTPTERRRQMGVGEGDFDLKVLDFQERLVPLYVERDRLAAEFGPKHPKVKSLDEQIRSSEDQFRELSLQVTARIKELLSDEERELEEAREAARSIVTTKQAEVAMIKTNVGTLNEEIQVAMGQANALSAAEQDYADVLKQISYAEDLYQQVKEKVQRVDLADTGNGLKLTALREPTRANVVGPSLAVLLAAGCGLGLMLGAGLAYLLEAQAGTFRSADEISTALGARIVGHVPFDPGRRRRIKTKGEEEDPLELLDEKMAVMHRPQSLAAEAVRTCRTSVLFEAAQKGAKIIQVTSPLPSDGKTTVAGNLAAAIAQTGKRVLAVGCDLRRPQLAENFGVRDVLGFTNVLNGECEVEDAIHDTVVEGLSIMPAGSIPANPAEALTLPETGELFEYLREQFDLIIVDTPPLLVVTDASIIANYVDGVLMAMKVRRKSKSSAKEAVGILRGVRAPLYGIIVNASDEASGSDGYRGYGAYRYSRYSNKYGVDNGKYSYRNAPTRSTVTVTGGARITHVKAKGTTQSNGRKRSLNGSAGNLQTSRSDTAVNLLPEGHDDE